MAMSNDQIRQAKNLAAANYEYFATVTELAEFIADMLDILDELDDETSELWDIAISFNFK